MIPSDELLALQMVEQLQEREHRDYFRGHNGRDRLHRRMIMTILYTLDNIVPVDPVPSYLPKWPKLSESVDLAIRRMESEPRFYHAVRSLEAMLMRDVDSYLDAKGVER